MKKVLFSLAVILSALLLFTSCEKTEFKFQFEVNGFVNDTANTGIVSEFSANVGNDNLAQFETVNGVEIQSLDAVDTKEAKEASAWVDDYAVDFIQRNFGKEALYSVHVKGYVTESLTGIIFAVDRVISNSDQMAAKFASVAPVVEDTAVVEDTRVIEIDEE